VKDQEYCEASNLTPFCDPFFGCILIIMQFAPAVGVSAPPGGVTGAIIAFPETLRHISITELGMALGTLLLILFTPRKVKQWVPPQLIALVVISLISVFLLTDPDIKRIGEIDVSLPSLVFPTFTPELLQTMILDGIVLGMLGCIDSMLTSVIADNLTRSEHKSDKELIGLPFYYTKFGLKVGTVAKTD
jgi:SulP family sulfate permease